MSILLIDNNKAALALMEKTLNSAGYRDVMAVDSTPRAIEYLCEARSEVKETNVDIILFDIMMDEMDGAAFCRKIREYKHLKDVPILIITACDEAHTLKSVFQAGANDYIRKPIKAGEMLSRIHLALRLKQETDARKARDKVLNELLYNVLSDLELAKRVQKSVLSESISNEDIQIDAFYQPCEDLAGDMYAWYKIDAYRYGIIILDVMGHGVSAALISMSIRSLLRGLITRLSDPIAIVEELNQHMIYLFNHPGHSVINSYFTAMYVIIDTRRKEIEYTNAGHPSGLLLVGDDEVLALEEGSLPVGIIPNLPAKKQKISYAERSRVVLHTDGLLEVLDVAPGKGTEKLKHALYVYRDLDNRAFLNRLTAECIKEGTVISDDVCLISITIP